MRITLNRAERKNSLTFDSYNELRNLFRAMSEASDIKAIILAGAGGNFCSGGDVQEIIGALTKLDMPGLLAFTRLTGDLVKAMRSCPQPVIAAIDGVCAGAGGAAYDPFGAGGFGNFSDIFESIFAQATGMGSTGAATRRRPQRGSHLAYSLTVEFEEAVGDLLAPPTVKPVKVMLPLPMFCQ